MKTFLCGARGAIYVVSSGTGSEKGFYDLEGLTTGSSTGILLYAVTSEDKDIFYPVSTLDSSKIIYPFGQSFGAISIVGELLLGPSGQREAKSVSTLNTFFQGKRLSSENPAPVNLSTPGNMAYKVYLVHLLLGTVDPAIHTQSFTLSAITAEPPE